MMTNGEPKTVRELYFYVKGKFDIIEDKIEDKFDDIEKKIDKVMKMPSNTGKWIIRIVLCLLAIGQFVLGYRILK
jgi:hypothetical protein